MLIIEIIGFGKFCSNSNIATKLPPKLLLLVISQWLAAANFSPYQQNSKVSSNGRKLTWLIKYGNCPMKCVNNEMY